MSATQRLIKQLVHDSICGRVRLHIFASGSRFASGSSASGYATTSTGTRPDETAASEALVTKLMSESVNNSANSQAETAKFKAETAAAEALAAKLKLEAAENSAKSQAETAKLKSEAAAAEALAAKLKLEAAENSAKFKAETAAAEALAAKLKLEAADNSAKSQAETAKLKLEAAENSAKTQAETAKLKLEAAQKKAFTFVFKVFLGAGVTLLVTAFVHDSVITSDYLDSLQVFFRLYQLSTPEISDPAIANELIVDRETYYRGGQVPAFGKPTILIGGMGVGKSAILRRFAKEQACCILIQCREESDSKRSPEQQVPDPTSLSKVLQEFAAALGVRTFFYQTWIPSIVLNKISISNNPSIEASFAVTNKQNFRRLWAAFENGLKLFKKWFPHRPVYMIWDEITFLLPTPTDPAALVALKSDILKTISLASIEHSLDKEDCQFIITSSSPLLFQHFPFNYDKHAVDVIPSMSQSDTASALVSSIKRNQLLASNPHIRNLDYDQALVLARQLGTVRQCIEFLTIYATSRTGAHVGLLEYFEDWKLSKLRLQVSACRELQARFPDAFRKLAYHIMQAGSEDFEITDASREMFTVCAELHMKSFCFFDGSCQRAQFIYPLAFQALQQYAATVSPSDAPSAAAMKKVL